MPDQPQVETFGDHRYLVRARQGDDVVEIRIDATPAVIARLTTADCDETRVIEATAAYLIARQRADDLPAQLDLDDVAAAYEGFEADVRRQLTGDGSNTTPSGATTDRLGSRPPRRSRRTAAGRPR